MHSLEKNILAWYVDNYPEYSTVLKQQIDNCTVTERNFTNGGGVFVRLSIKAGTPKLQVAEHVSHFEGPLITSSTLEAGADLVLWVDKGRINCIEIWSICNDYPTDSHVKDFQLVEQDINYIVLD